MQFPASKKTQRVSITNIKWLMTFTEITAAYSASKMQLHNVNVGGIVHIDTSVL
jgi:hypothetical protein